MIYELFDERVRAAFRDLGAMLLLVGRTASAIAPGRASYKFMRRRAAWT
jgi:hypothetical protein